MSYLEPPRPDPKGNPYLEHVKDQYLTHQIGRREFIQYAALLGLSMAGIGRFLASSGRAEAAVLASGDKIVAGPFGPQLSGTPRRGGTYRVAILLKEWDHPARITFGYASDVLRQSFEYLTFVDRNNIVHPYLLKGWSVNKAVDRYTFHVRPGVTWHDGKPFTADDVVYNFKQWFDPKVGSSVFGLLSPYMTAAGVEKVDNLTVRINLDKPSISLPYDVFHDPALIVPNGWEPADVKAGESLAKSVVGTGPFLTQEYNVGKSAVQVRNPNYWDKRGLDGKALPYIDKITWSDLGPDTSTTDAALQSGQIDSVFRPGPDSYRRFSKNSGFSASRLKSAQTKLIRMRVDKAPFTDVNVRTAFKLMQNRSNLLNTSFFGLGATNFDAHFAPSQPDTVMKPIPAQNIARVKELLAQSEAWQAWGNKPVNMYAKNDVREEPIIAEQFKRMAAEAGVNINLKILPPAAYWPNWNNYDFSVTGWGHWPLATMVQALAYTKDVLPTKKEPGRWNETRWTNARFEKLLEEANGTVDLKARRKLTSQMENIQIREAGFGLPYTIDGFNVDTARVKGNLGHPFGWHLITRAWLQS